MKLLRIVPDVFDKYCATLGAVFSTILIAFAALFITHPTIYYLVGFFSLLACIIWLLIRENPSLNLVQTQSRSLCLLLLSIFFIFFTFSVLSFYFRPNLYERPLIYFIFISLMVGIVGLELFFKGIKNSLILFQILLIGVSIAWSQLLLFPSLVGVDTWGHQAITLKTLTLHSIPDGSGYSKIPMFHLFIASTSLITGLNYKFASMISFSFLQVLCVMLLIFLLCMSLFNDYKVSLLASLSVIICNNQILMSYWTIPNGFGTLFILYILYCSLKLRKNSYVISTVLLTFFMIILILTHTIASLFMAIISFVYWFGTKLYSLLYSLKENGTSREVPFSLTFSTYFTVSMFSWWTFISGDINTIGELLKWGFKADFFGQIPQDLLYQNSLMIPISEQIFNNLATYSFFALSLLGCFYMISKKYGKCNTFCFTLFGLTPLFLIFFTLITQHSILEQRWLYFTQLFLSVPFAVSLLLLVNFFKSNYLKSGLLFILMIFFSFLMIMSPIANVDNHVFSPNTSMTFSHTMSELQAAKTISNIWDGTIKTDTYYSGTQRYTYKFEPFCDEIYDKNILNLQHSMVLIRKNIIGKPFKLFSTVVILDYDPRDLLSDLHFSKMYDCGSAEGYLKV
jgi:hypothetical protein